MKSKFKKQNIETITVDSKHIKIIGFVVILVKIKLHNYLKQKKFSLNVDLRNILKHFELRIYKK